MSRPPRQAQFTIERLFAEFRALKLKCSSYEEEIRNSEEERVATNRKLEHLTSNLTSTTTKLENLTSNLNSVTTKLEDLTSNLTSVRIELEQLKSQVTIERRGRRRGVPKGTGKSIKETSSTPDPASSEFANGDGQSDDSWTTVSSSTQPTEKLAGGALQNSGTPESCAGESTVFDSEDKQKPWTLVDLKELYVKINKLSDPQMGQLIHILQAIEPSLRDANPEEIEIDLDTLKSSTLSELEGFATSCLTKKKRRCRKRSKNGTTSAQASSQERTNEELEHSEEEKRLQQVNKMIFGRHNF